MQWPPVAGQLVHWEFDDGTTPDIYISNQAGTPVAKTGTAPAAGPDSLKTTTDANGTTSIGIRLGDPQFSTGENRVAGCIATSPTAVCNSEGGEPETSQTCPIQPSSCPAGENHSEDDVRLQWSATATPPPAEGTPSQGPPTVSSFSPTSGPPGTSVVVSGSNFTRASSVRFNGRAAAFNVDSPSQITTTVPIGATDGPISVQTPEGTTVSAANFDVTPSPSASPTPKATASPTSTASQTASATPTALSAVNLSLASSVEESIAFSEVVLSGVLSSVVPSCAQPGTTVEILKREAEATSFDHLAYVNTGVGGLFEQKVTPQANTMYTAVIGEHGTCDAGTSSPVTVLVSPKITVKTTSKQVEADRRFWITGSVLPEHQLTEVTVWRKTGPGEFKKIGKDFLDASSRYALAIRYSWNKPVSVFHVRWKATDADHISGKSPRLRVERA